MLESFSFIFVLLPLSLAVYYLAPGRYRPGIIAIGSLLLYAQQNLGYLWLLPASVLLDYFAARIMARKGTSEKMRRACMWFAVVKNLALIVAVFGMVQLRMAEGVLGVPVYALSGIDYVLAVYKRETPAEKNMANLFCYCCFFPRLFAGPLVPWADFRAQLEKTELRPRVLAQGAGRFVQGVFKYAILGGYVTRVYETLRHFSGQEVTVLSTWCMVFALALSLYYRLCGLCDIAQGLGLAFGIEMPNNFYYPYQALCVADFFERFNITVHHFIRRTVYAGLREDRAGPLSACLNLFMVGMLMGFWFGLHPNLMAWGCYLALFIVLERYLYPRVLANTPTLFARAYALCVILSSFTLFAGQSFKQSAGYLRALFGGGGISLFNAQVLYVLSSNWLVLVLSVLFAFSFTSKLFQLLYKTYPRFAWVLQGILDLALLVLLATLSL